MQASPSVDDHAQKVRISQAFVRELLGRTFPVESSSDVLDFLTQESAKYYDALNDQETLRAARHQLIGKLESDVQTLNKQLMHCGIEHSDEKFERLEQATLFCDSTMMPSISSLAIAFVNESVELQDLESIHALLLQAASKIQATQEVMVHSSRDIPVATLKRLQSDAMAYAQATVDIQGSQSKAHSQIAAARLPSLDMSYVVEQQRALDALVGELAEREAVLSNLRSLPPDLDEVLLENDRMSRQLERLDQHRRDLFRSIRK